MFFFLEFSSFQFFDAREKTLFFKLKTSLRVLCFDCDFDGVNGAGGGRELKLWNATEIKLIIPFRKIWIVTILLQGSKHINC